MEVQVLFPALLWENHQSKSLLILVFRKEAKPPKRRVRNTSGEEFYRRVKENFGLEPDQLMELLAARPEEPGDPVSLEHRRVMKRFGLKEHELEPDQ